MKYLEDMVVGTKAAFGRYEVTREEVVDLVAILAALRALRPGRREKSVAQEHVRAGVSDTRAMEGAAQGSHE